MRTRRLLRAVTIAMWFITGSEVASAADYPGPKIYFFSQPFCPGCEAAKAYLHAHDIGYREFDITASEATLNVFKRVGGRGTPFFIINGRRMQGFSVGRFEQYLKDSGLYR